MAGAKSGLQVVVLLTAVALLLATRPLQHLLQGDEEKTSATVSRIVDGDTIETENPKKTIRILGIDTPERDQCGYEQAKQQLEKVLSSSKQITLIYDTKSSATDRYGRTLAYLETQLHEDVGLELVKGGYAAAWWPASEPEPARGKLYAQQEALAQKTKQGLWGLCASVGRS